ncbi:hypothetical protein MLD38_026340 [Melastoma candidum]|uniref:Uncharacterized protein n=1 Tax=Melastoma candidum TaxID=119954 RepID=A0ACB9P149_9MYRT|nr:hypothetical protein MLD38_026340 [Melastoma candidum]
MLLGQLRRNFKHVMLVDVKNWVVLSDPFVGVQDRSSETVVIWGESNSEDRKRCRRGKKDGVLDAAQSGPRRVNPGAIVGGCVGSGRWRMQCRRRQ